jgi:hypothetical protein
LAEKIYQDNAPHFPLRAQFGLVRVPTRRGEERPETKKPDERILQVQWDALDPAINPGYVMLLSKSDFKNRPSFRAIWTGEDVIPKDGRSTVFGFTSNESPGFETVRLRGERMEIMNRKVLPVLTEASNPDLPDLSPKADGSAASPQPSSPTAPEDKGLGSPPSPGAPPPPPPPPPPLLGGMPATTGGSGGGSSGGAVPSLVPLVASGGGGGGGNGGGNASGTGTNQQNGQQQQNQRQQFQVTQGAINISIDVNQQQQQSQRQQQRQQQHQGQHQHQGKGHHPPTGVVPQPAALVLACIGLPFLLLLRRRSIVPGRGTSAGPR